MTKYHVVPGINGTRRRDSVTVCIKDWKYLIWSHGMYNNCINLGVYWQIICKYNLRICILYYRMSAWIHRSGLCLQMPLSILRRGLFHDVWMFPWNVWLCVWVRGHQNNRLTFRYILFLNFRSNFLIFLIYIFFNLFTVIFL